jgi:hypothetical protein
MYTTAARGGEIMPDHQFDAMIEFAVQLIKHTNSIEEALEALYAVKRGSDNNSNNSADESTKHN